MPASVFAGFATISIVWYAVYARKHFTGPPITKEDQAAGVISGAVVDAEHAIDTSEVKRVPSSD